MKQILNSCICTIGSKKKHAGLKFRIKEKWNKNVGTTKPVRNPSVILSPTLTRNERVEHYIRIKTHKPIALMFWVESDVNALCG